MCMAAGPLADKVGEGTVAAGLRMARAHSGRLQFYIGTAIVLVAAAVFYLGLND